MRKQLYRNLTTKLQRRLPAATKHQVHNLALLTLALVFSEDCHLPNLALQLPIDGQRDHLTRRLMRFLSNCHLSRHTHYMPLVRHLFATWPDKEVNLVMDRTDIRQEKSILLLAVAFKCRVIPLTWRVLPFGGTGADLQVRLLREVTPYLPKAKRVMFYGDTEFRAVAVQQYCRQQRWGWQLGVKSDTLFHEGDGNWQPLRDFTVERGQRRYLQNITLTQSESWPDVHLIADWTHNWDSPRYVICHHQATRFSWRRGRKRFWIEPTFRDWKSYGFDLETSHIDDARRLDRLLLGMTIATLWLLHLGDWVRNNDRTTWLTADHRRDSSIFRLGRDYARRSEICHWHLPICFDRQH
jgi:hypothetical protein